jgi:hypothetical protein
VTHADRQAIHEAACRPGAAAATSVHPILSSRPAKRDIDRSLLRENLKLTPVEWFYKSQSAVEVSSSSERRKKGAARQVRRCGRAVNSTTRASTAVFPGRP